MRLKIWGLPTTACALHPWLILHLVLCTCCVREVGEHTYSIPLVRYTLTNPYPALHCSVFFVFFFLPLSLPYCSFHYSPIWMLSSLSCIFATKGKTFPDGSDGKESACNAGGQGSIPGSGRSLGNPLQYSCLENFMDRRAWQAIVHRVTKSQTRLRDQYFHFYFLLWFSCSASWSVSSNLLHILNFALKYQLLEQWLTES